MVSVADVVENPNSIWFEEETYQADTLREVETIKIYNEEENLAAVFKRETGEFMTFCQPTKKEADILLETGNLGGQTGWFSGKGKNLPPTKPNVDNEITPINSFESDVLGITPAPDWQI